MKKVYFISDAHLGSWAMKQRRMQERRLVRFLDEAKKDAEAVYMLGDMFDFWYEYKYVVPKGYTRFLGKLSELTDSGIEVHYFIGNHDIWDYGYLERECGVIMHRERLPPRLWDRSFSFHTVMEWGIRHVRSDCCATSSIIGYASSCFRCCLPDGVCMLE